MTNPTTAMTPTRPSSGRSAPGFGISTFKLRDATWSVPAKDPPGPGYYHEGPRMEKHPTKGPD